MKQFLLDYMPPKLLLRQLYGSYSFERRGSPAHYILLGKARLASWSESCPLVGKESLFQTVVPTDAPRRDQSVCLERLRTPKIDTYQPADPYLKRHARDADIKEEFYDSGSDSQLSSFRGVFHELGFGSLGPQFVL